MKNKGFTLIELLAVILILGIIALIAIPSVTKIIDESKRGAFKSSVKNVITAIEGNCQIEQLRGENLTQKYIFKDYKADKAINIKGQLPKEGTITIDDSCNVKEVDVTDGNYVATKPATSDIIQVITIKEKEEIELSKYVCKRATSLHEETCSNSNGCVKDGYTLSSKIKYGNTSTTLNELKSGDAFDCDVNGDGVYDSNTERFYYISDYYDTIEKTFNNEIAVLVYYSTIAKNEESKVVPDNTSNGNIYYVDEYLNFMAKNNLPAKNDWKNVSLINVTRSNDRDLISYEGYVARLLTSAEINKGCNVSTYQPDPYEDPTYIVNNCDYLFENTNYFNPTINTTFYWLEDYYNISMFKMYGHKKIEYAQEYGSAISVRPAIEVPKLKIEY